MAIPRLALFLLPFTLAAADFTGSWASVQMHLILRQDGNKLSGTGGPSAKNQQLTFENGTVDEDRASFMMGSFKVSLKLTGDELRGSLTMDDGAQQPIYLKRVTANAAPGPTHFEVASVKRAPPQVNGISSSMRLDPGRVTMTNVSVRKLLYEAYEVKSYQVSGPDWLGTELYNITASLPAGAVQDDVRVMLRNLLTERFKVTVHRETKEMPVYALVQEKTGHRMKETQFGHSRTSMSNNKLEADSIPIRNLTDILSRTLERPVIDMTDLKGFYSFTFTFAPDEAPATPGTEAGAPAAAGGPNLERAVREIGLRLESRRAPIELLVIDHAEKDPTEN